MGLLDFFFVKPEKDTNRQQTSSGGTLDYKGQVLKINK